MITSAQSRAGRALVEWSQEQLAEASHLSLLTIRDFEKGRRVPSHDNLAAIQTALESAGIIFVAENGDGIGVRLRKKPDTAAELTRRIDILENDLAGTKGESPRTPEGGMRTLERAHKRNVVTKLKNRRTNLGKSKK